MMVGRTLSDTKKMQNGRELQEKWMDEAVQRYLIDKEKPDTDSTKKGLRTICAEVEAECFAKTKELIKLSKTTLDR